MEFKRNSVVALYLAGKSQPDIVKQLQHLNVNKMFVYRTIRRYDDTGSIAKRGGCGPKKTVRSPEMIRKVKARISRNPRRSGRKLARDLHVSHKSIQQILKIDLQLKPYKIQKVQDLTPAQKAVRLERCKALKRLHEANDLKNLVFSDEKIFTVQQYVNKQNDRVWLEGKSNDNFDKRVALRKQAPASVMVWAAVTANGRSPLVFIDQGVKVNQEVYRQKVLIDGLIPWARKQFGTNHWTFQQDSAPSHKARLTQQFLRENVPQLISSQQWPPYSPDLNPMDFSIWSILEAKVSTKKYESVETLKAALRREWAKVPATHVRAACDAFIKRLDAIIRAKGGYIEQ
jgi:transposase